MPLLASLPPGQYVVYSGYDKVSRAFYVVSMDGTFQGKLVPQGSIDARLSPDGKRIVFSDSESIFSQTTLLIFDLEQNTTTKILVERGCVHPSWGPDGQTLAIECRNIYVLSLQNGTRERLLPEYDPEQIEVSPEWSPDGKWIAYYRRVSPFPVDGPYLVDASCLADPLTCNAKTHRLVMLEGVLAWSPDSRYVAIGPFDENKSNTISIFDTQSSQLVRKLKVELGYGPINTMSWSPDGKWIAFTPRDANGIFLIPAESGEPTLLYADFDTEGKQVVFWLTVP